MMCFTSNVLKGDQTQPSGEKLGKTIDRPGRPLSGTPYQRGWSPNFDLFTFSKETGAGLLLLKNLTDVAAGARGQVAAEQVVAVAASLTRSSTLTMRGGPDHGGLNFFRALLGSM